MISKLERPLFEHRLRELEQEQRGDDLLIERLRQEDEVDAERIAQVEVSMSQREQRIGDVRRQLEP
jgi:hypothetical protein